MLKARWVLALVATLGTGAWAQEQMDKPQPAAPAAEAPVVPARDDAAAEKLGWRLAVQAWTFRDRTAFEAIDTAARLGVKYIELYPGQPLSPDRPNDKVKHDMGSDALAALKAKLKEAGVAAVNYGVVNPTKDKEETLAIFKFASDLGIETITCEPETGAWDVLEECCYETRVKAACHNHPKPSRYWDPKVVMREVSKRGQLVGVCADTGHWKRSGLEPVDALKRVRGRLLSLHFKDVKDGKDHPWGEGDSEARAMLEELRAQGFRGVIAIEYEEGSGAELEANVARCVEFFDRVAAELAKGEGR